MYNDSKFSMGWLMTKRLLGLVFLLAFTTTGFTQAQKSSRTEAYYHFSRAKILDDQGQPNQAIEEYKKALELDPNNSLIFSEMAESYLRNNKIREAVDAAEKAVRVDPNSIDAHKLLGQIYVNMISRANAQNPPGADTINNAVHEFEEIVRIDPSERQGFIMLGRLYQIKGDRNKAIEIYRKFLGIEPSSEEGVTALAKLHIDAGNQKEAVALLEDFTKIHPDSDCGSDTFLGDIAAPYTRWYDRGIAHCGAS